MKNLKTFEQISLNKWWGYVHVNGHIQVKRYFSRLDIDDAYESPFVDIVFEPFEVNSREEAIEHIKNLL